METLQEKKTALVLVDIQYGFDDVERWGGKRNNPKAEQNAAQLLAAWRSRGMSIFHVKHNSTNVDSPLHPTHAGNRIKNEVYPEDGEFIIGKCVNSGFIGTDLQQRLDAEGIEAVVICGLTTDQCVSTTTRMAGNFGYRTYLVADACATFDKIGADGVHYHAELIHQVNLASIKDEFATVINTNDLLQMWF